MKIVLNYEPATDTVSDNNGLYIGLWTNPTDLEGHKVTGEADDQSIIESIVRLKNAGCSVDEIIEMKKNGLV